MELAATRTASASAAKENHIPHRYALLECAIVKRADENELTIIAPFLEGIPLHGEFAQVHTFCPDPCHWETDVVSLSAACQFGAQAVGRELWERLNVHLCNTTSELLSNPWALSETDR